MADRFGGIEIATADRFGGQPVGAQEPTVAEGVTGRGEVLRTLGEGAVRTVAGGVIGALATPFLGADAGADIVRAGQEASFTPQTEAGKAELESLSGLVERGIDIVNFPLSGLGGILELVAGQGLDQAADTIRSIQQVGVSKTLGERVFEETGSPIAATIGETLPAAIVEGLTLKGAGAGIEGLRRGAAATGRGLETVAPVAREVAGELVETGKDLISAQGSKKADIARRLSIGSLDDDLAGFKLGTDFTPESKLGRALELGGKRVETDRPAKAAMGQGVKRGVVAAMVGASAADKTAMARMLSIIKRGKENARFQAEFRASDVVGEVILSKVKGVKAANKSAGKDIDVQANKLKGKPVDLIEPIVAFEDGLDALGVRLIPDGKGGTKPDFESSVLPPGDRGPIREVLRQMNLAGEGGVDGLSAHKMKRIIDNNVTFGKTKTGLSGDAEAVLKKFRREIDGVLDSNFPDYNKANIQYSETITAINDLQDAVGRKLDFEGPNAEKALGTVMGRVLSNAQTRIPIQDAVVALEKVNDKFKGGPLRIGKEPKTKETDFITLLMAADEFESLFDVAPAKSLQGQVRKGTSNAISDIAEAKISPGAAVLKAGAKGVDAALRRTDAKKFKALNEILRGRK